MGGQLASMENEKDVKAFKDALVAASTTG